MVSSLVLLTILISLASSEVPTSEEYERAKEALKDVLPRGADLPKAVRLGKWMPTFQNLFEEINPFKMLEIDLFWFCPSNIL